MRKVITLLESINIEGRFFERAISREAVTNVNLDSTGEVIKVEFPNALLSRSLVSAEFEGADVANQVNYVLYIGGELNTVFSLNNK
tara:strand:+ start:132 stop:389 length:258 start_codon:yes stop_codon:yes gene_type:complete